MEITISYPLDGHVPRDIREVPVGPERAIRLDIRALLNQGDGTFMQTNAIADDIALIVLRNLRQEGYINEGGGR